MNLAILLAVLSFGPASDGRTVSVHKGDTVKVALTECRDCGYHWGFLVRPARSVVKTTAFAYDAPNLEPGQVGGSGKRRVRLSAVGVGTTTLKLGYYPPGRSTPEKTYTLRFKVRR